MKFISFISVACTTQVFSVDQRTMAMLDRHSNSNSDDNTRTQAYLLAAMADYCIYSPLKDKQYSSGSSSSQTRSSNRHKHWLLGVSSVLLHNEQCGASELAKVNKPLSSLNSSCLLCHGPRCCVFTTLICITGLHYVLSRGFTTSIAIQRCSDCWYIH
jgi:hypothetical protein